MSSPSPSPGNSNQNNPDTLKTPAPKKKKEDYVDYGLSPPKLPEKNQRVFRDAVHAIQRDFNTITIEEELDKNGNQTGKLLWSYTNGKREYHPLACRILFFLYSRNYMKHTSQKNRKDGVKEMLQPGRVRTVIKQVIDCTGDKNLSFDKKYQKHYIRACLTIRRYFERSEASGFPKLVAVTFYLRMQKFGSCFLQAPCVAMSYLLQCFGKNLSPPNASRLIRHHFEDDQLYAYIVKDHGGDSAAIFKILEKKFFDCEKCNRNPDVFNAASLKVDTWRLCVKSCLEDGPGLVSKFEVPVNFECKPPSADLRNQFPDLDAFLKELEETRQNPGQDPEKEEKEDKENDVWQKIPAHLIPPGVTRFKTWNESGEFIPFDGGLSSEEDGLIAKWMELLDQTSKDDDSSIAFTASTEVDSSYERSSILSERSNSAFMDASSVGDDSSVGEDWISLMFDGEDDDGSVSSYGSDGKGDDEPGEGDDKAPLHAMVLLGCFEENGTDYWVLQNSWAGPMQILEFSTEYFFESGAFLYFFSRTRSVKPEDQWEIKNLNTFFRSPVIAESASLERGDCEYWPDNIVHSTSQPKEDIDFDDLMKTFVDTKGVREPSVRVAPGGAP